MATDYFKGRKIQKMFAYKDTDGKLRHIYETRLQVKMCFPNMKPKVGRIVSVLVTELRKKNKRKSHVKWEKK